MQIFPYSYFFKKPGAKVAKIRHNFHYFCIIQSKAMLKSVLLTVSILSASATATVYANCPGADSRAVGQVDNTGGNNSVLTVGGKEYRLGPSTLLLSRDREDSPYIFNDAREALEAINRAEADNVTLLVAPSVYWLDNPDDPAVRRSPQNSGNVPYAFEITCDTLNIIGLDPDPENTVFAVNRGQTQGALGNYTMLHFTGRSLSVENMTLGNYCNVDLVYPRDPSLNRKRRRDAIVQAQLGICTDTDRLFARNCRFISRLNLCPLVGARRSLYKDCYFECTDDALSGSGVYLNCRFTFYSGKPFYSTASTGAVFLNCDIHSLTDGTQYLTKVPGMVTMIDTRFTADSPVTLKWTRDASPVRCYQSNITLNGRPVTIDADRPELSGYIADFPLLNAYKVTVDGKTIYNTPNLLAGDDGWDPLGMLPAIREAEQTLSTQLLNQPVALRLTPSTSRLDPQDDSAEVTVSPRLWGDYPAPASAGALSWSAPTTVSLVADGENVKAVSANTFPREMPTVITATSPSGLIGATSVTVAPYLKPSPDFINSPEIVAEKSALKVNYTLTGDDNDDSYIIWYRSTLADHSDSTAVRHGHGLTARSYPLSPADKGCYISATVMPKLADSRAGEVTHARFDKAITQPMISIIPKKEGNLTTSFAEIPIRKGEIGRHGYWHFDTYKPADTRGHDWTPDTTVSWYYGHGADAAADGLGLVQATRGARLFYTPSREECRTMSVKLIAEPCKGPGQGFGSATGQYMDICVKFDPVSLTGYGLRIERTPDHDKAVTFTLVSYDGGTVTPISEPVASNCFRNPCTITIDVNDNTLTATAKTDAPAVTTSSPDIKPYVMLTAPVSLSRNPSMMIQHTGSVGASATLLRNLSITWK